METGIKSAVTNHFTSRTRKRAAALAMAGAAVAAGLVIAGPAGASTSAASPAASGTEHFQIMTTSTTSNKAALIAYGVFTAFGTDHQSNSNANTATDLFVFPGGSFKVTHTGGKGGTQSFNPKTCFFMFSQPGTYTLSGGTGKYKGISGHGTFKVSAIGIGPKLKSGACNPNQNAAALAQQTVVNGSGPVKLP